MIKETKPRYVVREPRDVEELEALLRLRYTVFRGHELRFLVRENEYGIDVDAWDKQAWHIGLYKQTEIECRPVGYIRFVHNGPERSDLVYELGKKYQPLNSIINQIPPTSHPFLERYSQLLSLEMLAAFQSVEPGKQAESSRFALLDTERSRTVSHFMIESVIAIFHLIRVNDLVFEVGEHHLPFYQHYGYRTIAHRDYKELSFRAFLAHSTRGDLAQKYLPRIQCMAQVFEEMQEIWLHTTEPKNFYPPYFQKAPAHKLYYLAEA